jgi:hypothetical protein
MMMVMVTNDNNRPCDAGFRTNSGRTMDLAVCAPCYGYEGDAVRILRSFILKQDSETTVTKKRSGGGHSLAICTPF